MPHALSPGAPWSRSCALIRLRPLGPGGPLVCPPPLLALPGVSVLFLAGSALRSAVAVDNGLRIRRLLGRPFSLRPRFDPGLYLRLRVVAPMVCSTENEIHQNPDMYHCGVLNYHDTYQYRLCPGL